MKCPKCGYVSFDFARACPKCNRDITAERRKLNLPSFEPAHLSLLGALIGESERPQVSPKIQDSEDASSVAEDLAITLEDLQAIETVEESPKGDDDVEIQFEPASPQEGLGEPQELADLSGLGSQTEPMVIPEEKPPADISGEELSLDMEDLVFEGPETAPAETEETDEYEILLEPDLSPLESANADKATFIAPEEGEDTFSFELDDLPGDESVAVTDQEVPMEGQEGSRIDLDELVSIVEELTEDKGPPDIESHAGTQKSHGVSPLAEKVPHDENFPVDPESLEFELELEKADDEPS